MWVFTLVGVEGIRFWRVRVVTNCRKGCLKPKIYLNNSIYQFFKISTLTFLSSRMVMEIEIYLASMMVFAINVDPENYINVLSIRAVQIRLPTW